MRRDEKEIKERAEIDNVIHQAMVCRLGLSDNTMPYIVPMNFGYANGVIYLHSALEGRKIDILRQNPSVCFQCDIHTDIIKSDIACNWGMTYQSVIGFGTATFIDDHKQKLSALTIIMDKYSGQSYDFSKTAIEKTAVIKISITSITGKKNGAVC